MIGTYKKLSRKDQLCDSHFQISLTCGSFEFSHGSRFGRLLVCLFINELRSVPLISSQMEEKMTEETMGEKKIEPPMGEKKTEQPIGEIETGAEILQKKRHTIREWLMILAFFLYTASLGLALNCKDDFNKKTDEVETLRDDLWISSVVCLVIGTAIWIDIIIASIRYKFPIGGPHMSVYLLGFGALAICFLTWAGYPYAE